MNRRKKKQRKHWTAEELRRLPAKKRDAILKAAVKLAERIYRENPELTAFEAFGEGDLYGHSASSVTEAGRNLAG